MHASRNLYEVLNVAPSAEPAVIDAAYRVLMKKYHPDHLALLQPGAPSAAEINHAFTVLRDPESRARYDHQEWSRRTNLALAQPAPPPPASRAAAWSGWFVAVLLGGVIWAMAWGHKPGSQPIYAESEVKAAAAKRVDEKANSAGRPLPAQSVAADVNARAARAAEESIRSLDRALIAEAQRLDEVDPPVPLTPRRVGPKVRSTTGGAPRARAKPKERDFLEEQGYIY